MIALDAARWVHVTDDTDGYSNQLSMELKEQSDDLAEQVISLIFLQVAIYALSVFKASLCVQTFSVVLGNS